METSFVAYLLEQSPLVVLLVLLVVAFMREWLVPGATHQRAVDAAKAQQDALDDLTATVTAGVERDKLVLGLVQGIDSAVRTRPIPAPPAEGS